MIRAESRLHLSPDILVCRGPVANRRSGLSGVPGDHSFASARDAESGPA
jgi:hypothetical protein